MQPRGQGDRAAPLAQALSQHPWRAPSGDALVNRPHMSSAASSHWPSGQGVSQVGPEDASWPAHYSCSGRYGEYSDKGLRLR